ncbi:unnamed protein product [Orchesella dallaii]|uniref:DOMON domain-containing protein n=1 Tax=Orchesella dallaii TaxID=48710 RepID=A0ABP1S249_9HEXA
MADLWRVVSRFKFNFIVLSSVLLFVNVIVPIAAYKVDDNPYRHWETLDENGKYELEWIVDWEESRVLFNVTVQTRGYVGFGLSIEGKMSGSDIVIGGVRPNGEPYFTDRHAIGNQLPVLDDSQDWTLHQAWENNTHTFLSFSRPFETCDEDHDLPITEDRLTIIWAFGENDNETEFHYQNRGASDAYLLDPVLTPRVVEKSYRDKNPKALGDLKVWTISRTYLIPPKPTTYMCTLHRAPSHSTRQHIVGFNSVLETDVERKHIHHFLLHRCSPPAGQDAASVFQRHVETRGEECYLLNQPAGRIPTQYCREVVHVWAVGGKAVFFPDHVGLPLADPQHEYYLLQMHYDNPDLVPGIEVKWALEIFYANARKFDAGVMTIGGQTPNSPALMVPPSSLNHFIYGHCGSGRAIRLIHIRDNEELPWIIAENNYNFNYQQNRVLRNEIQILPGDTMITRCAYETTDRNGSVTVGGFSTRNEMCNGFLWYYNRIPEHGICRSSIRSDLYRSFLDIWNTTWSDPRIEMVVTSPRQNAGLVVSEVGNRIDWTIERRNQIQKYHRFLPQITECPRLVDDGTSTQQPPPLRRYSPRGRIRVPTNNIAISSVENEILDPEYEYVSEYPKDIVPYELPESCRKRK